MSNRVICRITLITKEEEFVILRVTLAICFHSTHKNNNQCKWQSFNVQCILDWNGISQNEVDIHVQT